MRIAIVASGRPETFSGPKKKYEALARGLEQAGHDVTLVIASTGGWQGAVSNARNVRADSFDHVIVRTGPGLFAIWPQLVRRRMQGEMITIEVPTPASAVLRENVMSSGPLRRAGIVLTTLASAPWLWMIGNRVVGHSEESRFFSLGLRHKLVVTQNLVDVERFRKSQAPAGGPIQLAMVGALSEHHGLDRLVDAMARQRERNLVTPRLRIIGEGPSKESIASRVHRFGLNDQVDFFPTTVGEALDDLLDGVDIAVGSLAMHRLSIKAPSPLKHREYLARGLPVLYAGDDPGLVGAADQGLCLRASDDESPIELDEVVAWATANRHDPAIRDNIYRYAREHFDLRSASLVYIHDADSRPRADPK